MSGTRKRGGFTLLELMVALAVGGIALGSIYTIGSASTKQFERQMDVATAQTALRLATAQIKRDIARAGFLATPNIAAQGQSCGPQGPGLDAAGTSGALAAFSHHEDNVPIDAAHNNKALNPPNTLNAGNGFTTDDLVVMGNYETSNEYGGIAVDPAFPNSILVDPDWHAFRTDFTDWATTLTPTQLQTLPHFASTFRNGRMVRLQTLKGEKFFAQVFSASPPPGTNVDDVARIVLQTAIPPSCLADANGGRIAPVNAIRYTIVDSTSPQGPSRTGPVAQLIRTEVRPDNKRTPLAGATQILLDYAVAFNVSFLMSQTAAPGAPDSYTPGAGYTDTLVTPERVRAVRIEIANRTRMQDPNFAGTWRFKDPQDKVSYFSPALCAHPRSDPGLVPPLIFTGRCFQVFADEPGAARVRVSRSEVFVPNVAFEGY